MYRINVPSFQNSTLAVVQSDVVLQCAVCGCLRPLEVATFVRSIAFSRVCKGGSCSHPLERNLIHTSFGKQSIHGFPMVSHVKVLGAICFCLMHQTCSFLRRCVQVGPVLAAQPPNAHLWSSGRDVRRAGTGQVHRTIFEKAMEASEQGLNYMKIIQHMLCKHVHNTVGFTEPLRCWGKWMEIEVWFLGSFWVMSLFMPSPHGMFVLQAFAQTKKHKTHPVLSQSHHHGSHSSCEPLVILVVATIGVAGGTGVGLVLVHAMRNCGCSSSPDLPDRVEGGITPTKTFKIFKAEDIEALTPLSAELKGKLVKNSSVPYKFSFVVGKGFSRTRRSPVYHAGLLIVGKFEEAGQEFPYIFADRWLDCVRVTLFKEKRAALAQLREIAVFDIPLTDCDEIPAFTTFTPAGDLVQYVQDDLAKHHWFPHRTGFGKSHDHQLYRLCDPWRNACGRPRGRELCKDLCWGHWSSERALIPAWRWLSLGVRPQPHGSVSRFHHSIHASAVL